MRVTACYGWDDGSSIEVVISDDLDEYNPLRTSDLTGYARDLLRNAKADADHSRAEHKAEGNYAVTVEAGSDD